MGGIVVLLQFCGFSSFVVWSVTPVLSQWSMLNGLYLYSAFLDLHGSQSALKSLKFNHSHTTHTVQHWAAAELQPPGGKIQSIASVMRRNG